MDSSFTSMDSSSKKLSLEELSKEELLKKCRNLLAIAQKAKQARDAISEENAKLKNSPTDELIHTLTQQKLDLVTKVDELTNSNNLLNQQNAALKQGMQHSANLDTEYQASKRQTIRLIEENEQLLTHLNDLESQIAELNRIGLEQQQQLLILEQNNTLLSPNNESNILELQNMLKVTLDEVQKAKDHSICLESQLIEKDSIISALNATIDNKTDDLNTEIHKNRALVEKLKQDIDNTRKQLQCNQIESSGINAELQNANEKQRERLKFYHSKILKLAGDVRKIRESKQLILNAFKTYNQQVHDWKEQLNVVSIKLNEKLRSNDAEKRVLEQKLHESTAKIIEFEAEKNEMHHQNTRLISELKKAIEKLENDAENARRITESKLTQQTSEVCSQNKTDELHSITEFASLKRENAELLVEMNVMNQALKERGETINQHQIHCEELMKKIQVYESQLVKSQDSVQHLQDEVTAMRSQSDDCDALSTSTISRYEEGNRLKELEGSWEERYGKLRTYALKLKAKAKQLQDEVAQSESEKSDLQTRLTNHMKTTQTMQGQLDDLLDKLDESKEDKHLLTQLTNDNQRLRIEIANRDENVKILNEEKSNLDAWKKQVSAKVQALRKELEANALMRKEFESKIVKLQSELDTKVKEQEKEREKLQSVSTQLQDSQNECKKQSLLNLEMKDYERSIKELSAKLERKNEHVTKLKNQIDAQKSSSNATKEENRLLAEKTNSLETELDAYRIEIRAFKKQIVDLEIIVGEKENKCEKVRELLENTRSENDDLSTQLSNIVSEHQRANLLLREEKDHFRNENVDLEQRLRILEDQIKLRNDELLNIAEEYQSYKVRAQSVLRQNQSRDVAVEEKLVEEAASLRAQIQIGKQCIQDLNTTLEAYKLQNDKLAGEKLQYANARNEIQRELEKTLSDIEKLNIKHQEALLEHNETVRSVKLHTETLSQCYRQQISEQEVRHNREIIELQSKYDKNPSSSFLQPEIPSLLIPSTIREEGEGSESVDSASGNVIHPLEKLLGADHDHELNAVKKQLSENETRVVHLTSLLADTEQDLAKHMQMNKLLKEEIRRHQRSVEREKHAENLEYMKNVVFKFITLTNGDERMRLVPVLNTILKLSPEETNKLNNVAKTEKSWSNYLPIWSTTSSRPQ